MADKGINTLEHKVILNISEKLPVLEADKVRLQQILRNLMDNAAKYLTENTEIRFISPTGK